MVGRVSAFRKSGKSCRDLGGRMLRRERLMGRCRLVGIGLERVAEMEGMGVEVGLCFAGNPGNGRAEEGTLMVLLSEPHLRPLHIQYTFIHCCNSAYFINTIDRCPLEAV